ncbi:hypothetical protein ElyMa_003998700 [Elysia marginata]|uniref:Fibronectin type-III domain-containing protein n=1 Tax=Elysia marginata TaxID=1093978 RepID=A0AAV4G0R9_9GAST|nr:hypothetical protein ElyMa_003998700 [Elysia marginata]
MLPRSRIDASSLSAKVVVFVVALAKCSYSTEVLPTTTASPCERGWSSTSTYCYQVFDEHWMKARYQDAKSHCNTFGAQLLSEKDVDDTDFTCQIDIAHFGTPDGTYATRGGVLTLQCRLSVIGFETPLIRIGHKTVDGSLSVLKEGRGHMLELVYEDTRCVDSGEYICEVDTSNGKKSQTHEVALKKYKSFWVAETAEPLCKCYKTKNEVIIKLDCEKRRPYVCKTSPTSQIDIAYFDTPDGTYATQDGVLTLQCRLSVVGFETPLIRIGHKTEDGLLSVLKEGRGHMLELVYHTRCVDSGEYVCEVDTSNGKKSQTHEVALKKCPPVWCSARSFSTLETEISMGVKRGSDACVLSAYRVDHDVAEWFRNGAPYEGEKKPFVDLLKSQGPRHFLEILVAVDSPILYGQWGLRFRSFYDGAFHYSKFLNFTVSWKGPPIFCPQQATIETVQLDLGESYSTRVCILSPVAPSRVSTLAPRADVRQTDTSVPQTRLETAAPDTDLAGLAHYLYIEFGGLKEGDVGNWSFVVDVETFSLHYELHISIRGPPQLCPGDANTIKMKKDSNFTVLEFEPLHFSLCVLSPSGTPPTVLGVVRDSDSDAEATPATVKTSETFETSVLRIAGSTLRYKVNVTSYAIKPEDSGTWKIEVADPAAEDGQKPFTFRFNVESIERSGPPECPSEVTVQGHSIGSVTLSWLPGHDGGTPQSFIVFYSYMANNGTTDTRKWLKQRVPLPSNGQNVSSTIGSLPADTTILFRVAGVNKFNRDSVTSSTCEEVTANATTGGFTSDATPESTIIPLSVEESEKKSDDDNDDFEFNMLYIIIAVSVLVCIILFITVAAVVICKRRAAAKNKHRTLRENSSCAPTDDGNLYSNAKAISEARSTIDRQYKDEAEEEEKMRESLIYNPVFRSSSGGDAANSGRCLSDEGLVYVSIDHSATSDGMEADSDAQEKPTLKTFAPRLQIEPSRSQYANFDFARTSTGPLPKEEVVQTPEPEIEPPSEAL